MNVIVAAHPDDEVIGLGAQLPKLRDALFVQVTDGAPRNTPARENHVEVRRNELIEALALAGIAEDRSLPLHVLDREASRNLSDVIQVLCGLLRDMKPQCVVTHPYEGGHPDHDATAFACHVACRLLKRDGIWPGILVEFTSYHWRGGTRITGEFLPSAGHRVLTVRLTPEEQAFKRALFSCFRTQSVILADFPVETEKFRVAPAYDFTRPPHHGRLYYENFPWGMTGPEWRSYASEALCRFGF